MIDVVIRYATLAIRFGGQRNPVGQTTTREFFSIKIRRSPARCRPRVEVRKLDVENRRLDLVEPEIATNKIVIITRPHSMLTNNAQSFRQFFATADD